MDEKKITERSTGYTFYRFWNDFSGDDDEWQEYDGGSFLKWRCKKDLKGLCSVSRHFFIRGNSLKVKLRDLVGYISERDSVFASRVGEFHSSEYQEMMDMETEEWVDKVFDGDRRLRNILGLED